MIPEDLLLAYQSFTLLATQYGFAYAGMMTGSNPPSLIAIGNVIEQGQDFAALLRVYADIYEEKTRMGLLEHPPSKNPN